MLTTNCFLILLPGLDSGDVKDANVIGDHTELASERMDRLECLELMLLVGLGQNKQYKP